MDAHFFHSMFRTGSTHFQQLIESAAPKDTMVWKEALHEVAYLSRDDISIIENYRKDSLKPDQLSHGLRRSDYFLGLENSYKAWKNLIDKEIIYDGFFSKEPKSSGSKYFAALADWHGGKNIFVECRTGCRIGALKKHLGGSHAYLYREPIAQWLSYKTTDPYFETTNLLIMNGTDAPNVINDLKQTLGFVNTEYDELAFAFDDYLKRELSIGDSYSIFFLIWCLCFDHASQFATTIISVDEITKTGKVSPDAEVFLSKVGIAGVDWRYFKVPGVKFPELSSNYFFDIEGKICELLKNYGWDEAQLANLQLTISQARDHSWNTAVTNVTGTEYEIREFSRLICEEIQSQNITETKLREVLNEQLFSAGLSGKSDLLKQHSELLKKYDALANTYNKIAVEEQKGRSEMLEKVRSEFLEKARKLESRYLSTIKNLNDELHKIEQIHAKHIEVSNAVHEANIENIRHDFSNEIVEVRAETERFTSQRLNDELDNLKASRSWKITKPLRTWSGFLRRAKEKITRLTEKSAVRGDDEIMTVQEIIRDYRDD